ncbi:MAG: T9SS type A sorting domain-containing protein [Crocinitomicaceae bacterium]
MKLKQLLLACSIVFSTGLYAQSYTITGLNIDTAWVNPCDSIVTIAIAPQYQSFTSNADYFLSIQGSIFLPGPIVVGISWGDGTTSTYTGQSTAAGVDIQFGGGMPQHIYPLGSNYTMVITVTNPSNNTYAMLTETVYLSGNCNTFVYGVVNVDCNADGIVDSTLYGVIPFEISNTLGNVYSGNLVNGQAILPTVPNGLYTIQLNSVWLAANNYSMASVVPTAINVYPGAQTTFMVTLNCVTVPTYTGCSTGQVYCDDNGNGVFDSGETGIASAPVIVSYNNQSYYGITDANGFYTISFPNPNTGIAVITVNAGWLAQSGYYLTNNTQSTTVTLCSQASNYPTNFAVDCDSSTVQSECVIGWVFCDANTNGILDSGEVTIPYAPVTLTSNGNSIVVYSNSNGVFNYSGFGYLGSATTISINQYWLSQHGYTMNVPSFTTSTNCNSLTPVYVGINCGSSAGCADLWTLVTPWIGYYQNQTNYVKLKWGNYGPSPAQSYILTMTYPAGVTPITSSIFNQNYTISGNTITWVISGSNGSNFISEDVIYFSVPGGLVNGTQHIYSSTITATGTNADCYTANNNGSLMMILGNSYDPNDKNVSTQTIISPSVQDELTYTIRFQNTGTAPAQDIYILDTLSANLDWTTMKMIHASHDMQLIDLGNGVMKFNFPGIWLPDSTSNEALSHGELTYSIKENAGNGIGSQIFNTAHIYFDWNPAIVTNTTFNENNVLGILENETNKVLVMPNPFNDLLNIQSAKNIDQITVTDITGKTVYQIKTTGLYIHLDLSTLTSGVYLVNVYSNNETSALRVIKK